MTGHFVSKLRSTVRCLSAYPRAFSRKTAAWEHCVLKGSQRQRSKCGGKTKQEYRINQEEAR